MTSDAAATAYPGMYPEGFESDNSTPARILLRFGSYSPGRQAARVRCPILVIGGERDTITLAGPGSQGRRVRSAGRAASFDGRHFDIDRGPDFDWAVGQEVSFLTRVLA